MLPRFRAFRDMNPYDELTTLCRNQPAKEFPRFGIGLERLVDVLGQLWDHRFWRVAVARRRGRKTGRRKQFGSLQFTPASPIEVGPLARSPPRRDLEGVSVLIQAPDQAVDPSKG